MWSLTGKSKKIEIIKEAFSPPSLPPGFSPLFLIIPWFQRLLKTCSDIDHAESDSIPDHIQVSHPPLTNASLIYRFKQCNIDCQRLLHAGAYYDLSWDDEEGRLVTGVITTGRKEAFAVGSFCFSASDYAVRWGGGGCIFCSAFVVA